MIRFRPRPYLLRPSVVADLEQWRSADSSPANEAYRPYHGEGRTRSWAGPSPASDVTVFNSPPTDFRQLDGGPRL